MRNVRGAGRHARISDLELEAVEERHRAGESIASLAAEHGISRQALSKRLKEREAAAKEIPIDVIANGILIARLHLNPKKQYARLENYTDRLSQMILGRDPDPDWDRVGECLETLYLGGEESMVKIPVCQEVPSGTFSLKDVAESTDTILQIPEAFQEMSTLPRFEFRRRDLLLARTDTDGFQLKALSSDRRWFVKSQAVISGVIMNDWKVEVLASRLCRQLGIACVEQYPCEFIYEGRRYQGVCSANFELDGYSFVSFERLAERMGKSTREEEFIALDAIGKMHWCAGILAEAGNLPEEETLKYMLDLALVDCLVGNVDRHTRNFGLFYNNSSGKYEIPMVFDNGMGLFEHDYYRDQYGSYDEAMRNVYVSPYGENPFDMIRMLNEEFDLTVSYPGLTELDWGDVMVNRFSEEYVDRMKTAVSEKSARTG